MKNKLKLYSCFHGNLLSSNIPEKQYSLILDRCYWPIIELAESKQTKIGIEFPVTSLNIIEKVDKSFIAKIKNLQNRNLIEFIGAGYTQAIQPLLPYELNKQNLLISKDIYQHYFDKTPEIYYLNEQNISQKTHLLYQEVGIHNLLMDFDCIKPTQNLPYKYIYNPATITNSQTNIIWNSSIAFQRFQRYIHGSIDIKEMTEYITSHYAKQHNRSFMFYGSDWEIFDYKPGEIDIKYTHKQTEFLRLEKLITLLKQNENIEFILPKETLLEPTIEIPEITTASHPIITKKQDTYNITRWAVCGRNNTTNNTELYDSHQKINTLKSDGEKISTTDIKNLLLLMSSDYRTFTTENKYHNFLKKQAELSTELKIRSKEQHEFGFFTLKNQNNFDINNHAYSITYEFIQSAFTDIPSISCLDQEYLTQATDVERYRDGSIRKAKFLFYPQIKRTQQKRFTFIKKHITSPKNESKTNIRFDKLKGHTIKSLIFKDIDSKPLIGKLDHQYYQDIRVSTDQFSGHMLLFDQDKGKVVDLQKPEEVIEEKGSIANIIKVKINTPLGKVWKTYTIFHDIPRIDIKYHFRFCDFSPLSFRLGTLTFVPESFDQISLSFSTVNGTNEIETHPIDQPINHGAPVSLGVSSHCCLGATESWVSIQDKDKGIAVICPKNKTYSVPMIEADIIDGKQYLRLYHSIAEKDATSQQIRRGHSEITFTIMGHNNNLEDIRKTAKIMNAL